MESSGQKERNELLSEAQQWVSWPEARCEQSWETAGTKQQDAKTGSELAFGTVVSETAGSVCTILCMYVYVLPFYKHAHFIPIVGVGKRGAY